MRLLILCALLLFCRTGSTTESITLKLSQGADPYIVDLISLLLSYQEKDLTLEFVENIPTQDRAIRLLGQTNGIDIFWSVTSEQREKQALAIRVPIVKGVLGYRLGIIRTDDLKRFQKYAKGTGIRAAKFGLRSDWPDHDIFVSNGFKVTSFNREYNGYEMLAANRFDVLPTDVLAAVQFPPIGGVMVDPYHVYYYPSAVYFFVHKENQLLSNLLKAGFEQAIQDGKFEALFQRHFADKLKRAKLSQRKHIMLSNSLLPASAPIHAKKYWYHNNQGN